MKHKLSNKTMDNKPTAELKLDLILMLECLKCQQDNPVALKQALFTISSICVANDGAKEIFQEKKGVDYLWDIVSKTAYTTVRESALYCLGCCVERNVSLQKKMSTSNVFSTLYNLLSATGSETRQKLTVSFLILCIVANNSYGQVLAMKSSCLQALIHIFRSCLVANELDGYNLEQLESNKLQLWTSVASTLSMCVNNPQNDDNQRICATLLPYILKLFKECHNHRVIRPLGSFLGLLVANNVYNQDRVKSCGGLEVLVSVIQRLHNQSRRDTDVMPLTIHIVSTLDSCIADNAVCAEEAGSREAVSTLLSLLSESDMEDSARLQIILTLGHLTDPSEANQKQFIEAKGTPLLIKLLAQTEEEEMGKAIKFLLQSCHQSDASVLSSNYMNQSVRTPKGMSQFLTDEPTQRNTDTEDLIIKKINQLANKLDFMEKDMVKNATETQKTCVVSENEPIEKSFSAAQDLDHFMAFLNCKNLLQDVPGNIYSSISPVKNRPEVSSIRRQNNNNNVMLTDLVDSASNVSNLQPMVNKDGYESGKRNNCGERTLSRSTPARRNTKITKIENDANGTKVQTNSLEDLQNLTGQKERLLNKLNQEKARNSVLEKEAETLRNHIAEQKKKEQNIAALREELERQEGNITSSSEENVEESARPSSEAKSVKSKADKQCDTSNGTLLVKNTNLQSQKEKDFVKPDSNMLSIRRAKSKNYTSNLNHCKVSVGTRSTKSDYEDSISTNHHLKVGKGKSLASDNNNNDKFDKVVHSSVNNLEEKKHLKLGKGKSLVSAGSSHNNNNNNKFDKVLPSSVSNMEEKKHLKLGKGKSLVSAGSSHNNNNNKFDKGFPSSVSNNEGNNSRLYRRLPSSSLIGTKQRVFSQDLNASFVSDSTCMSEFDTNLIKGAQSSNRFQQSLHRKASSINNSWSVKRKNGPVFTSTPKISHHRMDFTDSARNVIHNNFANFSVKPLRKRPCDLNSSLNSLDEYPQLCDQAGYNYSKGTCGPRGGSGDQVSRRSNGPCPGCFSPRTCNLQCLDSRTYNIVLETSPYTCDLHRNIRTLERTFIHQKNMEKKKTSMKKSRPLEALNGLHNIEMVKRRETGSVYRFDLTESTSSQQAVTPPYSLENAWNAPCRMVANKGEKSRKPRVPYTDAEIANLILGVRTMGKRWQAILCTYEFHPCRTSVDLMEKYKRLRAESDKELTWLMDETLQNDGCKPTAGPLSLCEERRLRRGVKQFGYSWKMILDTYKFAKGRTKEELRSRWRCMHKKDLQDK